MKILMIKIESPLFCGCSEVCKSVLRAPEVQQVISRRKTPLLAAPDVSHCLAQGRGHYQTYTGNTANAANALCNSRHFGPLELDTDSRVNRVAG